MSAADTAPDPKKAQVKGENTADVGMDPGASSVDYEKELEDRFEGFFVANFEGFDLHGEEEPI
jgi:hypothetical protein